MEQVNLGANVPLRARRILGCFCPPSGSETALAVL